MQFDVTISGVVNALLSGSRCLNGNIIKNIYLESMSIIISIIVFIKLETKYSIIVIRVTCFEPLNISAISITKVIKNNSNTRLLIKLFPNISNAPDVISSWPKSNKETLEEISSCGSKPYNNSPIINDSKYVNNNNAMEDINDKPIFANWIVFLCVPVQSRFFHVLCL